MIVLYNFWVIFLFILFCVPSTWQFTLYLLSSFLLDFASLLIFTLYNFTDNKFYNTYGMCMKIATPRKYLNWKYSQLISTFILHSLKNLFSQKCMYAKKKEKKIMTIYLQNQENLFFCLKSGQMGGRTCVVCDQLKNVRAHTLHTHVSKVFSHAHTHVRPHITRVRARTHLRNPYLAIHNAKSILI